MINQVSELHQRDSLRTRTAPEKLQALAVSPADVGKILVLLIGQNQCKSFAHIFTREEFLALPLDRFVSWYELSEFDITVNNF